MNPVTAKRGDSTTAGNPARAAQPAGPLGTHDTSAAAPFAQRRVHMVGIGGSGMCGLAALLLRRGARVSGTDQRLSIDLARLSDAGARVSTDQSGAEIPADVDLVVASAAISADHPELLEARRRGVRVLKYAQLLGELFAQHEGVAIAGTHGKSTTSAWLAFVLRRAGLDPSFVVGAQVQQLEGGSGAGDGPHFVAEACEYDRSFLNLAPRRAAILNIEDDHLDYYRDLPEIQAAFGEFAGRIAPDGLLVTSAEDARCRELARAARCRVETFGVGVEANWQVAGLTLRNGTYSFTLVRDGRPLGPVTLTLSGVHNVSNALAVSALATDCGVSWDSLRDSLAEFGGARRRLELRGEIAERTIVDDYAHHPTEIRATLLAARQRYSPRCLWCVFQPHQHSRTRFLLEDFARSFDLADRVIVPDIYFVRDSQRERELVSARDLVDRIGQRGGRAEYIPDFEEIALRLCDDAQPGDLVLTMGAGNIWKVADELVARLRNRCTN